MITMSLTTEQARLVRREVVGMEYGRAAEFLGDAATGWRAESDLGRHVEAQAHLAEAVAEVEQFGGWGDIDGPVEVTADPDVLYQYAYRALDGLADELKIDYSDDAPSHDVATIANAVRSITELVYLLEAVQELAAEEVGA